jgi:hypothetical protein
VRLNRLDVKCPAGISDTRDGFPPELNPKWAGQLTWTRAWDVCGNRPWRYGRHVKQLIGILAKPSPHFSTWDMMATPKEKNVPHLPGSATTITKSGRLSRSPNRYGHNKNSSRWPGRRVWKHLLIRTEVKPIARLTSDTSFPATPPYRPLFGVAIAHVYHHNDAISRVHDLRLCI